MDGSPRKHWVDLAFFLWSWWEESFNGSAGNHEVTLLGQPKAFGMIDDWRLMNVQHTCMIPELAWLLTAMKVRRGKQSYICMKRNEQVQLSVFEEVDIWLACRQSQPGFIWPETMETSSDLPFRHDHVYYTPFYRTEFASLAKKIANVQWRNRHNAKHRKETFGGHGCPRRWRRFLEDLDDDQMIVIDALCRQSKSII